MIVVSGSSNQLYYDVACQAAEPAKKEGRIWVKSSVPMTHFEFSPKWGSAGIGTVAIQGTIGGANPLPTNNVLEVFQTKRKGIPHRMKASPASCMQVQGTAGNWVNVDAYVCHGGTWVQFSWTKVYLYKSGDSCNGITGNWKSAATGTGGWGNGSVGNNDGTLNVNAWNTTIACAATNKKIDLSKFKTLTFVVSSASGMENGWHRGVLLTSNSFNWNPDAGGVNGPGATSHSVNITGPGTFNIDISGQNEALYVGVAMAYQSAVSILEIYLS